MNTSPAVMHNNYIRYGMTEQNEISLNNANNEIGLVPNQEMQSKVDEIAAVHEASLEARRKKMTKILEHRMDSTTHTRSYLVQYDDGEEEWVPTTRLHGARQIVTEFMERTSPLQSPTAIRLRESIRVAAAQSSNQPQPGNIQSTPESTNPIPVPRIIFDSCSLETNSNQVPSQIELIPTFALCSPAPTLVPIPSLVSASSSQCSSPQQDEDVRNVAASIAAQLIENQVKLRSPGKFQRRNNDWLCDECGYDNFSYRTSCRHCNKTKIQKRRGEQLTDSRPTKKAKTDIVAVLEKSVNKENEVIYKVKSVTQGVTWVREKHVPVELL